MDIIDNIITYSLYSPYYVTKTSANGSAVYWSRDTCDNDLQNKILQKHCELCTLCNLMCKKRCVRNPI